MTKASRGSEDEESIKFWSLIETYCAEVDRELEARLMARPPDFTHIHVHEVIGGMLARQATLAKDVAGAPMLWTGHTAPVLLRAMTDVYINVAWLLLDPVERCRKFILFGLGQAKLELEHRRAQIGAREPTPEEAIMLEVCQSWIDDQRLDLFLDVDLGKWSNLSVRQMAKEAGCIDFYSYVYAPFSACAHSMWHHIARYNLRECSNSLHRNHRRPASEAFPPDAHYLTLAAKYWSKTLDTFDQTYGLTIPYPSSYETLVNAINNDSIDPQPD